MILNIENGESGLSVRSKLNQAIATINSLNDETISFRQNTTPTVRPDLSSLVAGDRLYDTSDNSQWFWNGAYWLSPQMATRVSFLENSTAILDCEIATESNYNIFLKQVSWSGRIGATNNATTNYREIRLIVYRFDGTDTVISTLSDSRNTVANQYFAKTIPVNFLLTTIQANSSLAPSAHSLFVESRQIGSPGQTRESIQAFFHLARK